MLSVANRRIGSALQIGFSISRVGLLLLAQVCRPVIISFQVIVVVGGLLVFKSLVFFTPLSIPGLEQKDSKTKE